MSDWAGIGWLVVLLAVNAFFVAAEFAVISARRSQIEPLAERGKRSAKTALFAMEHATLMLATTQLGITVCSLLILQVAEPRGWLARVESAGSVFLGAWTPESVGDYASGSNHVLPTYGYAHSYSGVSVASFQKQISVQELTPAGLRAIGPCTATLAAAEQLEAHRLAVTLRLAALDASAEVPVA